jgi:superfamily I DNA/RNA helicase
MSKINILAKNLLILASAGTGKTYQLSNRIIGLIASGVEPERIVALTFTRKAAGEFADAVLTKLAAAASDPAKAARLQAELGLQQADFPAALEATVRALPRLTLGTMDSFFARVVRGFQYELGLTGGTFDLLEGPRAEAAKDELLAEILGGTFEDGGGEFFHAFRRAMIGREDQKVSEGLRRFVQTWQGRYRADRALEWGPSSLSTHRREDWEIHKHALATRARAGLGDIAYTDKRQLACLEKLIDTQQRRARQPVPRAVGRGAAAAGPLLQGLHPRRTHRRRAARGAHVVSQLRDGSRLRAHPGGARRGGGLRPAL